MTVHQSQFVILYPKPPRYRTKAESIKCCIKTFCNGKSTSSIGGTEADFLKQEAA